ncbi:uncharacterized protein OCT59_010764 [Rhizophagus irregularis]|uniref:Uncharacterized protein n=1 Tax=Rhizophagus irregularis (strain DAOM 181602 / DAOM 197198 / MUCL 43194) TaxID=747089 RepID=U9UFW2_RHIID|nr:hypothetical protein GLOIN_2v1585926 [Rhizophagus irregularis DAOM 181602=DAOM 197198]POG73572.1 hypothetical protein GLOIN_2v1585926 [Rhizophagus irregularis DAOM 181602=DAOM 197198]UZO19475.1 hypothetical protein OCT59_010764 [Rhizophagus irregularis]GBC13073.2 ERCC4 domain-containing protein [Rhizophagus irregularis DAOM 181602=DAOM 197198]CAG8435963.1 13419_t:CDS:2 [Rhizophagus irregularis]|eukprot:XP_025180438.1 hypothetical protein GLOIN_2v1585926 [Rhizophagus irregularis DAOM 181602=DAOM 197198]
MADSIEKLKNDKKLQVMASEVQAICGEKSLEEILVDLYKTQSVELTINRIFDGNFLEGTRLDPLKVSKISFPIHLLNEDYVTSTKNQPIKTNFNNELLSTNSAKTNSSTFITSEFDDKPSFKRLPSDLESNFIFSCSIDDNIKPIKNSTCSTGFSKNLSHIQDRKEKSSINLTTKKNTNRNSIIDLTAEDEDSDATLRSEDSHEQNLQKPAYEFQPKIISNEHQSNVLKLNQGENKNLIETTIDNLNYDDSVTHQKRKRKDVVGQANVNPKMTEEDKLAAKKIKEAEKLEKKTQKEQQKLERKRQKEEREAEKKRLKQIQEVNKIKGNKLEICREIIVDVSNDLSSKSLVDYLRDNPKYNYMTINTFQHDIPNIIKWRRKVTAEWDDELCAFMPIPEKIQDESFLLIYFDVSEFIKLIKDDNLSENINRLRETFINKKLVILIEGYENYCRKRKTQINRNFTDAVRLGIEDHDVEDMETTRVPTKKKKKNYEQEPDLEEVEEKFLWLQIIAKCLIIHTKDFEDTAETIGILSTDIATIPYKNRNCDLNFWVEGQVRVGTGSSDTWLRMLQEIQLVTEPVARGIINIYPTVKSLYDAYKKCLTREEAESLLSFVEIPNTGFAQRRCINKPLSKKIYEIFMGTDPDYIIS